MKKFGLFYLDKEKDMIVEIYKDNMNLSYVLKTPNHKTGNLISNLSKVCNLPITYDEEGLKIIEGNIPCYFDGNNQKVYILRMGNTKVANIYEDGSIERKAYVPAIAKTLMSQTKDYNLDIHKTLVKTYIREEVKFHSDLHTHRSANLSPDILIALGIHHQLRYPYYYVKKLNLKITDTQYKQLEKQRREVSILYKDSTLKGKYLDRKIDDHTEINFADLILNNIKDSSYNISKIRASLAVMKDGQAVFTNLEKVYLYRYVFTKGKQAKYLIKLHNIKDIEDEDIVSALLKMEEDRNTIQYKNNTLYQDKLLWTARSYQKMGIVYAEISDTALVKKSEAASTLKEIHEIMPSIYEETGVTLRFLAALRRIPLTIVKDNIENENYFSENLQVLKAISMDPYVSGSDFVGEEINDIRELKPIIKEINSIAKENIGYVVRIHAGENDSLPDNVLNSILCVQETLDKDQEFPHMRIGHGLYTANLKTNKGKQLLQLIKDKNVILEFQITSNVRLNNLSSLHHHPLKQYLKEGISCVQGSDGCALYGSDSIDEQLSLERMLELSFNDLLKMRKAEDTLIQTYKNEFNDKLNNFNTICDIDIEEFYNTRIISNKDAFKDIKMGERKYDSSKVLNTQIKELPQDKIPIVIAGGSFNNASHTTKIKKEECKLIDTFIHNVDTNKVFFVVGPTLSGYEKYIFDTYKDIFEIYAFVPNTITEKEYKKLNKSNINIRVSIESSSLGTYKSFAYEIFKRRQSIILAFDGNSAANNLIQDAKNSKYKSRTFINIHCRSLKVKAESLQGYITFIENEDSILEIIRYVNKYYDALQYPSKQLMK